jgi:hypothetical protein
VTVSTPAPFDAVSVTVYVPAVVYVCTGLRSVDVPPSPKDQAQDVGEFVDESMNLTFSGTLPSLTFEMNAATGAVSAAHAGMTTAPRMMRRIPAMAGFE